MNKLIHNFSVVALCLSLSLGAIADSRTELSSRMSFELDDKGALVIKNNYLSNFLLRGIDSVSGAEAGIQLIKPSAKRVDFDLADVEFDGWVPNVELKWPSENIEKTELDLSKYDLSKLSSGATWENINLQVRGGGLINAAEGFLKKGWSNELTDPLLLTGLDALKLLELSASLAKKVITDTKDGKITNETAEKVKNFVGWTTEGKERLEDIAVWVTVFKLMLETIEGAVSNISDTLSDDDAEVLNEALRYQRNILVSLEAAESALKSFTGLSIASEFKEEVKEDAEKVKESYLKGKLKPSYQDGEFNSVLDAISKQIEDEYKEAQQVIEEAKKNTSGMSNDELENELIELEGLKRALLFSSIIDPVDNMLQALRNVYVNKYNDAYELDKDSDAAKKLATRIKALDIGHGIASVIQLAYMTDTILEGAKKESSISYRTFHFNGESYIY